MAQFRLVGMELLGIPMQSVIYQQNPEKLEAENLPYNRIVVHHAGSKNYTIGDLISYHMDTLGMGAIGYHFAIGENGEIFHTRDLRLKGAHTYPNSGKLGICFLRSLDYVKPNTNELHSLNSLTSTFSNLFDAPIVGHTQDQLLELLAKYPHIKKDDIKGIWVPKSKDNFSEVKDRLQSKYPECPEIHKLKICPGIMAYEEMRKHANTA